MELPPVCDVSVTRNQMRVHAILETQEDFGKLIAYLDHAKSLFPSLAEVGARQRAKVAG